jgi:hypothetical protein
MIYLDRKETGVLPKKTVFEPYFKLSAFFQRVINQMSLLKGTASYVCFMVEGNLPENFWDYIAERIVLFSFKDIDDSYDENSLGWVSLLNMFDSDFSFGSYASGNFVTLSLRFDERKVSPAILKKFIQKEEERIKKEKKIPKISRSLRVEIKERVKSELIKKAIPLPSVWDLCWNINESTLLFFTTNKKAQSRNIFLILNMYKNYKILHQIFLFNTCEFNKKIYCSI